MVQYDGLVSGLCSMRTVLRLTEIYQTTGLNNMLTAVGWTESEALSTVFLMS